MISNPLKPVKKNNRICIIYLFIILILLYIMYQNFNYFNQAYSNILFNLKTPFVIIKQNNEYKCTPIASLKLSSSFNNTFGLLKHECIIKIVNGKVKKIDYDEDLSHNKCDMGYTTPSLFSDGMYKEEKDKTKILQIHFLILEDERIYHIEVFKTEYGKRDDNFPERFIYYKKTEINPCTGKLIGKTKIINKEIYFNSKSSNIKKKSIYKIADKYKLFDPIIVTDFVQIGTNPEGKVAKITEFINEFYTYQKKVKELNPRIPSQFIDSIHDEGKNTSMILRFCYKKDILEKNSF